MVRGLSPEPRGGYHGLPDRRLGPAFGETLLHPQRQAFPSLSQGERTETIRLLDSPQPVHQGQWLLRHRPPALRLITSENQRKVDLIAFHGDNFQEHVLTDGTQGDLTVHDCIVFPGCNAYR